MKNFLKNSVFFIALLFIILNFVVLGYAFFYVKENTSFLNFNVKQRDIEKNNDSTQTSDTTNLTTLTPSTLIVPDKFKNGVFATERTINLPENFKISLFAGGFTSLRFMDFDNNGNIYVTDIRAGKVFLIKDTNNDGISDESITIDDELRSPHGIDYFEGDLFVGEENRIIVYRDIQTDGTFESRDLIIDNLPVGGHPTRTIVVGPDRKLYVSIGSSCNLCEEDDKRRAAVVKYNLDGTGEEIYAEGLRNSVGLVFKLNDNLKYDLWSVDNGRDRIGDDIPPEEVNVITEKGKHYGWPYCYGDQIANPEYPERTDYCKTETELPTFNMQAHSAPLGLTFMPENSWPSSLSKDLFISFHGSWNRSVPTGYKIVRIDATDEDSEAVNFATGWLDDSGNVWGRPVDVKFFGDKMFISDDQNGSVYLVEYIK